MLTIAPDAGRVLLSALIGEDSSYARELMADALGELHHRPAIPTLIEMLKDDSERIRRVAAWALGEMEASEAEPALRSALGSEDDALAADRMREALTALAAAGTSS